jgi:CheY-like chemotaxis protein
LTNLVKNAIKFTNGGSIKFGYVKKDQYLEFYVKDTGIGIPADRQEAVFDRFVQADIGDTRVFEGSGLGLSISKAFVEMLGGRIWLESEEGKGTTFFFTIPYNVEREDHDECDDTVTANGTINDDKKLKILIADDDETSEMLVSIATKNYCREMLRAANGIDAVQLSRNHSDIDLILMDIKMPGMNGYDATREIRKFNKKVIIIAQTAYALAGERDAAIAAGCNDYIAKPFGQTALAELVNKYF